MVFKAAQTFYIDRDALKGAFQVTISSVALYVKAKPLPLNNKSGIAYPGLYVTLFSCKADGTPNLSDQIANAMAVREFNEIVASSDAKTKTTFAFNKPVVVATNMKYALVVTADGDEDFTLWNCTEGQYYVGTNVITSGSTAKYIGDYFEYTSSAEQFASQVSATTIGPTQNTSISTWKPLKNVELKFSVSVAVNIDVEPGSIVANSTNANTGNNVTFGVSYVLPNEPYEFMVFDKYQYSSANNVKPADLVGQKVYQETPVSYGTLTVQAANSIVVASNNINFNSLFDPTATEDPFLIIKEASSNTTVIRKIVDIQSNTQVMIDGVPGFNSNTCTFVISPVAEITSIEPYWYAGTWWNGTSLDTFDQKALNVAVLQNSNANSSVRFVNNHVTGGSIGSGGTGYSNTDYAIISCGVPGSLNATANLVTSNTGVITGLAFANAGYGFTNTASFSINNANNVASTGTGATLTFTTGQNIKTERPTPAGKFSNVVFDNFEAHRLTPSIIVINSVNATIDAYQHFAYYAYPSTINTLHKLDTAARVRLVGGDQFTPLDYNDGRLWMIPSRSNDVLFANTAINATNATSGLIANTDVGNTAGSITEYVISSNNVFTVPCVVTPDLHMYQYIINDDATGENKRNGNAIAKHISTKVTFTDRKAEDLIVKIRAQRPDGTDIKVYAKLHNSDDPEAFDDKDWSELTIVSNNASTTTSLADASALVEYDYGLPMAPAIAYTSNSTVTTTLSSNVVTGGVGSSFDTQFLASDVVKISSTLFPDNYQIAVVGSVANSSQLTLRTAVSNNSIVGTNMRLDLIGRVSNGANAEVGLPMAAFNNALNDNVVRYYNSALTEFDSYDSFAVKIVPLSSKRNIVPKIEDVRAIGVTT